MQVMKEFLHLAVPPVILVTGGLAIWAFFPFLLAGAGIILACLMAAGLGNLADRAEDALAPRKRSETETPPSRRVEGTKFRIVD